MKKLATLSAFLLIIPLCSFAQKHYTIFTQTTIPFQKETEVKLYMGDSFPYIGWAYNGGECRHVDGKWFLTPNKGDSSILTLNQENGDKYSFVYHHKIKHCRPIVRFGGAYPQGNGRETDHYVSLESLLKIDRLYATCHDNHEEYGKITSAQFIHAPRQGDARLVRLQGDSISETITNVLKSAVAGDRIIFDKIRWNHEKLGNRTLLPILIEIVDYHAYAEDSVASKDVNFVKGKFIVEEYEISDTDRKIIHETYFNYNKSAVSGSLTGTVEYFTETDSGTYRSATAVFQKGELQEKTYYFYPSKNYEGAIKRKVELADGQYIQSHYNRNGDMVAQGEVSYSGFHPIVKPIQPTGFEGKNPFTDLGLESEYRLIGTWTVYENGVVKATGLLSPRGENTHSARDGKWSAKTIRKYKRLINPEF